MNLGILLEIFWVFFKVSVLSFGGMLASLPEVERIVVNEKGWVSHELFLQAQIMGRFVPGPNAMYPMIGYWVAGWGGLFAAFLGVYLSPFIIMLLAFVAYENYKKSLWVKKFELAVRPVIIGLLFSSSLHIWWVQSDSDHLAGINRISAIILAIPFISLYKRGRVDPIVLILSFGLIWWLLHYLIFGIFGLLGEFVS